MKKNLLSLVTLITLSHFSFAQTDYDKKKENKYKWGCGVAINSAYSQVGYVTDNGLTSNIWGSTYSGGNRKDNSFSFSIIPKYMINDNFLIRFEFGWTKIDLENNLISKPSAPNPSNSSYGLFNDNLHQKIFRYVPGIQLILFKKKIIESYCGFTLPIITYSDIDRVQDIEQRNINTDTLVYWNTQKVNIPGGIAFGAGALAGFSLNITEQLSIGAEFSASLLYNKIGGEADYESTAQSIPSTPIKESNTFPDSYKGIKFSKILSSLNISVRF